MVPANIVSNSARILRPVLLCLLLAGAAGCGYKGPLYLPEPPPGAATQDAEDDEADSGEQDRQRDLS